eukprot:2224746-Rhodomonas_salina.1
MNPCALWKERVRRMKSSSEIYSHSMPSYRRQSVRSSVQRSTLTGTAASAFALGCRVRPQDPQPNEGRLPISRHSQYRMFTMMYARVKK